MSDDEIILGIMLRASLLPDDINVLKVMPDEMEVLQRCSTDEGWKSLRETTRRVCKTVLQRWAYYYRWNNAIGGYTSLAIEVVR